MKTRILIILALTAASIQPTLAQATAEKKAWIDLQLVQHIGLSDWSNTGYVNEGLPSPAVTEFRGTLNLFLADTSFGAFADLGMGIMPAADMTALDIERMPMPNSGTPYYMREILSESGSGKVNAHFRFTFGLFGNFQVTEKLSILPYAGIGTFTMPARRYNVLLKEQGSNLQYNTEYAWIARRSSEDAYTEASILGNLSGRLKFQYKLTPQSSLLFGLEYTYFFHAIDFTGRYTNTFNENIRRDFAVEGNKMNMLGLSVGISFR